MSIATPMKEPTEQTGGASARACPAPSPRRGDSQARLPPAPFPSVGRRTRTGGKDARTSAPCVAGPVGATRRRLAPAKEAAPAFRGQSSVISRQRPVGRDADVVSAAAHRRSDDFVSFGSGPRRPGVSKPQCQPKQDALTEAIHCAPTA
jgi:hypothetical protein